MEHTNNFDFAAISKATRGLAKRQLTVVVAADGGWATEPADTRIAGQFCRIGKYMSAAQVEEFISQQAQCE